MANRVLEDFYIYSLNFTALAATSSSSANLSIEADSDFKLQKLTFQADIGAAIQTDSTRVIPLATILITDSGSGRQLMNQAVPITAMFGTGEIPFILPVPKMFKARSTITATVQNLTASVYNIRLAFIGAKIFQM